VNAEDQRVLIVDDNPQNIQLAAGHLQVNGINVAFARSGAQALRAMAEESFDLLLFDVMMPEMDGFELCRKVKEMPQYREVPVIFLTARSDNESIVKGFQVGAVDYIAKPFFGPELVSRVATHLRLRSLLTSLEEINARLNVDLLQAMRREDELSEARESLVRFNRKLHRQAMHDPLTGLANRRQIMAIAEYEHSRLARSNDELGVVICDLDHFKRINDQMGHPCGDQVLQHVARVLVSAVRQQDQVSRWGGEEFLILLPNTSADGAAVVAEKVRAAVASKRFVCTEKGEQETSDSGSLTMTFGVTSCGPHGSLDEAFQNADDALYQGKRSGRNYVVVSK